AQLGAGGVVVGPEGVVGVAGDDTVRDGGLDVPVKRRAGGHVGERGRGRVHDLPALGQHDDLGDLPPGDTVVGPEGAVGVAANHLVVGGGLDEIVVGAAGQHVGEMW